MFGRKSYNEQQIHKGIKEGDTSLLIYLFEKNYVSARNYILQYRNATDEDVKKTLQEAVLEYWFRERQPGYAHHSRMQRAIMDYVESKWEERIRHEEEEIALREEIEAGAKPEDVKTPYEIRQEKIGLIEGYLGYLGKTCREMMHLTYFDRLSDEEIGQRINLSPAEVEGKKVECLKKLDETIAQHHSYEELI